MDLDEVNEFVRQYHHLPGLPSADTISQEGGIVMDKAIFNNLEKIEELFLHTIEQEKKIKALERENEELLDHLKEIKTQIQEIKAQLKQ